MGPVTKLLLVLALVVPVGAYVAGSLAVPGRDEPADRGPVILRDAPASPSGDASPAPARPSQVGDDRDDPRDGQDQRQDRRQDEAQDDQQDDEARVVKPRPTPVGEDDDDDWDDDGPDDDTETERDDDRDDD